MTEKLKEEPFKQRYNANARERDRTFSVNMAFNTLRTLIPTEPADRKLSKIETLRLASSYISHLDAVLIAGVIDQPCMKLDDNFRRLTNKPNNFYMRPQVCTFCLSSQKKYTLGVTSSILPDLNCQEYIIFPTRRIRTYYTSQVMTSVSIQL